MWYPEKRSADILAWIREKKGIEYVEDCGRYTVKDLGILSYIVRFITIETMLKKAPDSFHDAFNYGQIELEIHDDHAIIKMKDTAIDENTCPAWVGVFKGMLEMTKTKGTVKEIQCELKGSECCIFRMDWS